MTPEQFVYWLQGYLEISDTKQIDEKQVNIIRDHLDLVFKKETPPASDRYQKLGEALKYCSPNLNGGYVSISPPAPQPQPLIASPDTDAFGITIKC